MKAQLINGDIHLIDGSRTFMVCTKADARDLSNSISLIVPCVQTAALLSNCGTNSALIPVMRKALKKLEANCAESAGA